MPSIRLAKCRAQAPPPGFRPVSEPVMSPSKVNSSVSEGRVTDIRPLW